jgi:uncharacterized protein YrzB (UPF0473 family)
MFDLNTINKRYFDINISVKDDDGKEHNISLQVEPPKIKTLKKIVSLSKNKDDEDSMSQAISLILSKNKTGSKVPDSVIDELDMDQYTAILTAYFKWLGEVKNDPN